MTKPLFLAAVLAATAGSLASPAAAQNAEAEADTVNMVIVYGDDACPQSTPDQIVVCARQSESERYRIPEALRFSDDPANEAWANRVEKLEMIGDFGALSCSPAGLGGFTGCTQEMIKKAYADKAEGSGIRFGQLIAEAREERLSTIDEDAAAEQGRVEQIEREYMERLERERAAATPGEAAESLPQPETTTPDE